MKFIAENAAFAEALSKASGAIRPSTIPILGHVAVLAEEGDTVTVRANNLEREIEVKFAAQVERPGSAALPGEVLAGIVRRLPKGGECELQLKEDIAEIAASRSKYHMRSLPYADFPLTRTAPEEACTFEMDGAAFREALKTVSYAAREDHPKFYCRGVHLHSDGRQLVATANDHHRLALYEMPLPAGAATMPDVTIPIGCVKTILDVVAGAATVQVSATKAIFQVRAGGARLATAIVDCEYPDYRIVIPKLDEPAATFKPYVMTEALERASVVFATVENGNKIQPRVRLQKSDDGITMLAGANGGERGRELVEAEVNGHALDVAVTAKYLSDMLRTWPEKTELNILHDGGARGVLFKAPEVPHVLHVIMPNIL